MYLSVGSICFPPSVQVIKGFSSVLLRNLIQNDASLPCLTMTGLGYFRNSTRGTSVKESAIKLKCQNDEGIYNLQKGVFLKKDRHITIERNEKLAFI